MRALDEAFDRSIRTFADVDRSWMLNDRRGRWAVIEPGAGRLLKKASREVRDAADQASCRRVRRFSSLSRARAFCRSVNGEIRHWRRVPIAGPMKWETPWERATRGIDEMLMLPSIWFKEVM